jgi:hypothetical protein
LLEVGVVVEKLAAAEAVRGVIVLAPEQAGVALLLNLF